MEGFYLQKTIKKSLGRHYITIRICKHDGKKWVKTGHNLGWYTIPTVSMFEKIRYLKSRGYYQVDQII
jgi:hypothetical protein